MAQSGAQEEEMPAALDWVVGLLEPGTKPGVFTFFKMVVIALVGCVAFMLFGLDMPSDVRFHLKIFLGLSVALMVLTIWCGRKRRARPLRRRGRWFDARHPRRRRARFPRQVLWRVAKRDGGRARGGGGQKEKVRLLGDARPRRVASAGPGRANFRAPLGEGARCATAVRQADGAILCGRIAVRSRRG